MSWTKDSPFSIEHDDLYWSKQGAIEESEHVFLRGNNLEERWGQLSNKETFLIGELGFGAGINFLNTWKKFIEVSPAQSKLHYLSFDNRPFIKKDLLRMHSQYPTLANESKELISKLPLNAKGLHRINFAKGKITLSLLYGDLDQTLNELKNPQIKYDAWYLDGFSPAKNPEMWSAEIASCLAEASHSETTFSTYTVAGFVKKNFERANFSLFKLKGFGKKRSMLAGKSNSEEKKIIIKKKTIGIVGAGIAGCSLAKILAERGHNVIIFDKEDGPSKAATGNPFLVAYPRLSAHDSPYARFSLHSYLFSSRFYDDMDTKFWKKSGVLMLGFDENSLKREKALCNSRKDTVLFEKLDKELASKKAGFKINHGGLFFKDAGYIDPEGLCEEMIDNELIEKKFKEEVKSLKKESDHFHLKTENSEYVLDHVCLCNAFMVNQFTDFQGVSKKRGQISYISTDKTLKNLEFPICAGGYLSPKSEDKHLIGSSYSKSDSTELIQEEHNENLKKIKIIYDKKMKLQGGRVGFRTVTRDRLPLAGVVNGIHVNIGHGSKGSTSAPLCSEYIADLIDSTTLPVDSFVAEALKPDRFKVKN